MQALHMYPYVHVKQQISSHVSELLLQEDGDVKIRGAKIFKIKCSWGYSYTSALQLWCAPSLYEEDMPDATNDFFDMIVNRVSLELSAVTNMVENLKGKYLAVFVPQNYWGITGIPPVVIEVTPDIPLSWKPKAHPVNPNMMSHVFKEFTRLSGYLYVPSYLHEQVAWSLQLKRQSHSIDSVVIIEKSTNTSR